MFSRFSMFSLAAGAAALAGSLWINAATVDACEACRLRAEIAERAAPKKSARERLVAADNALGFKLVANLAKEDKDKNVFISPLSINTALSMTYNGAGGETAAEMAKALQFGDMNESEVNEGTRELRRALTENKDVTTAIANSLWLKRGEDFRADFLERVAENYGAEIRALDFSDPESVSTINNWCDKNTHGKIKEILKQIPAEAVLYLINAVYFKGTWKNQFDKNETSDGDFTLADGKTVSTPLMRGKFDALAIEGEGFDAVKLPYKGGSMSMMVFVPTGKNTLDSFVSGLSPDTWARLTKQFSKHSDLAITLPRFKVEYEKSLVNALKDLGMKRAFSDTTSDFTRMQHNTDGQPIFISDVKHKTFVEVNEEGTEAAAVTAVECQKNCVEWAFCADRPFFYAICDEGTGAILFAGLMRNPAAK